MRNPQGYAKWFGGEGAAVQSDTFTCQHCQQIVFVQARASAADQNGWCALCAKPVCRNCASKGCDPFEKKLERAEARGATLRSMGLG